MSEEKVRGIVDVQQDYQSTCTQAGHIQYQIFTLQRDLELINQKLRDFNLEAAKIKADADAAAKEVESEDAAKVVAESA